MIAIAQTGIAHFILSIEKKVAVTSARLTYFFMSIAVYLLHPQTSKIQLALV